MPEVRNGDTTIHYVSDGPVDGTALVLLHGLGSQLTTFDPVLVDELAGHGFRVIRLDNRDSGLSTAVAEPVDLHAVLHARRTGAPSPAPYTLSDMAGDVVAVLDALAVRSTHVVGSSLGGMIAQTLAIEHPARVRSVTSIMATTGEGHVGQATPEARDRMLAPRPPDRDGTLDAHLANLRVWGSPGHVDEAQERARYGQLLDRAHHLHSGNRHLAAIYASDSRVDGLRRLSVPVLVIHGSADTLIDPSGGRRTAELVPGARYVEIEGMGHHIPAAFRDQVVALTVTHCQAVDRS